MTDTFAWDPERYGTYDTPRLRPALDLLARIHHPDPRVVHDLGTGRGEMARAMADRWPSAEVTGSDLSAEMLDVAKAAPSRVRWQQADIRSWMPSTPLDVIYSNAVLHWIDDHVALFPRLVSYLDPGGVLAVQMPLSWAEPSHRLMRETLATGGADGGPLGSPELRGRYERRPVHDAASYHEMLAPLVSALDIWETRYLHALDGDDPVFEWVSGTALRPILDGLAGPELNRFADRYREALRKAYPRSTDGTTLFPFPRLFILATR